jgi:hypothetical protein
MSTWGSKLSTFLLLENVPSRTQDHFAYCIREERTECFMTMKCSGSEVMHIISPYTLLRFGYEVSPEKAHELKA